jgi:hypothetical protein
MDLLERRVRWWWSLLGLIGVGAYRLALWVTGGFNPEEALIVFVAVIGSYGLWKRAWWGGADAKTAMTLVVAIPDLAFIAIMATLTLVVAAIKLLAASGGRKLLQVVQDAVQVVRSGEREGERLPLVAVMVAALPIYLLFTLLVA